MVQFFTMACCPIIYYSLTEGIPSAVEAHTFIMNLQVRPSFLFFVLLPLSNNLLCSVLPVPPLAVLVLHTPLAMHHQSFANECGHTRVITLVFFVLLPHQTIFFVLCSSSTSNNLFCSLFFFHIKQSFLFSPSSPSIAALVLHTPLAMHHQSFANECGHLLATSILWVW